MKVKKVERLPGPKKNEDSKKSERERRRLKK
jgi:hypothetical protein